jgi:hypothetical protein
MQEKPNWPDWKDSGAYVEVDFGDGCVIKGKLVIAEVFFDGEEEIPVFDVKDAEGLLHNFANNTHWKFV